MSSQEITAGEGLLPASGHDPQAKIQSGHAPMMEDRTATPLVSPRTLGTGVNEFKVPSLAVVMVLKARVENLKWGRTLILDGAAGQGFFVIEDGQQSEIPVAALAGTGSIFVQELAVGGLLDFYFVPLSDKLAEPV